MPEKKEVATIEGSVIEFDFAAFEKQCKDRADMIAAQAVDWRNPNALKPMVTENNKWVKEKKAIIEDTKEKILQGFGFSEFEGKLLASIKLVEDANKTLQRDRLEAEKTARKEKAKEYFHTAMYDQPDALGTVLLFDDVWEDEWAKTTVTWGDVVAKMAAKVARLRVPDVRLDAFIEIEGIRTSQLTDLETYLISHGFKYTIERRTN